MVVQQGEQMIGKQRDQLGYRDNYDYSLEVRIWNLDTSVGGYPLERMWE